MILIAVILAFHMPHFHTAAEAHDDSLYEALSSFPLDSLSTQQYKWLQHERQRRLARASGRWTISDPPNPVESRYDSLYRALRARSPDSLSEREYGWLLAERERRSADTSSKHANLAGGLLLVVAVLGTVAVLALVEAVRHLP